VTSVCIPATAYGVPAQTPPSRQHDQEMLYGSLKRSKMTALLLLKVVATELQKAGAWSASAICCWLVARADPAAVQCKSRIATRPFWFSRLT